MRRSMSYLVPGVALQMWLGVAGAEEPVRRPPAPTVQVYHDVKVVTDLSKLPRLPGNRKQPAGAQPGAATGAQPGAATGAQPGAAAAGARPEEAATGDRHGVAQTAPDRAQGSLGELRRETHDAHRQELREAGGRDREGQQERSRERRQERQHEVRRERPGQR